MARYTEGILTIKGTDTEYRFIAGQHVQNMRTGADYLLAKFIIYGSKEDTEGVERARSLLTGMLDYFRPKNREYAARIARALVPTFDVEMQPAFDADKK